MTSVYTKVPSMTAPKMLKSILRVTIKEYLGFSSVSFLGKKSKKYQFELMMKINTLKSCRKQGHEIGFSKYRRELLDGYYLL